MMYWLQQIGLWESIVICLAFSFVVIGIDEWVHAKRRRQRQGQGSTGH